MNNRKEITMLVQWLRAYVSVYSDPLVLGQLTEAGHNYTRVLLLRRERKSHLLLKSTVLKSWFTCSAVQSDRSLLTQLNYGDFLSVIYLFPLLFFSLFVDCHETKRKVANMLLLTASFTDSHIFLFAVM